MNSDFIHPTYLPFRADDLRQHFLVDKDKQVAHFLNAAARYASIDSEGATRAATSERLSRQIEKDERFWTACALKHVISEPSYAALRKLLQDNFGSVPPFGDLNTWDGCFAGGLQLVLEAAIPSPLAYSEWLRTNLDTRHLIPYVKSAAANNRRPLEGPTHVDALFINPSNGFAVMVEAKALSDISGTVTFDLFRNQLIRNVDVMLERTAATSILGSRDPDRTLLLLLTPECFKAQPHSRLYGWLFRDYKTNPTSISRDLPHRRELDVNDVSKRLGWIAFEEIERLIPGACPWLR